RLEVDVDIEALADHAAHLEVEIVVDPGRGELGSAPRERILQLERGAAQVGEAIGRDLEDQLAVDLDVHRGLIEAEEPARRSGEVLRVEIEGDRERVAGVEPREEPVALAPE